MAKEQKKQKKGGISLLTPKFRVAYPHVFRPQKPKSGDGDPKYSITMLFDKNDDLSELQQAIKAVKVERWGSKENWPEFKHPVVVDGDKPKHADKEGYKGHWAIKASTGEDRKPTVVDEDVKPIIDPAKFYPGCYAIASIYITTYDNEWGAGVRIVLDHVQKVDDGKPFGGKKPADQVFKPVQRSGKKPAGGDDDGDDFSDESGDDSDDENF